MPYTSKTLRLGLLVPSSNSTQEPEFIDVLPATVSLHAARLTLTDIDTNSTERMVEELERESRKLADADVGAIVLAATAPSSRKGLGYDRELAQRIQGATGKAASTAASSMIEAFDVLGIRRIALAAPWTDAINQSVAKFMEQNRIHVVKQEAMGIVRNNDVGLLGPDTAYGLGRKADTPDAQALFLACGNWCSASIVEKLETEIGKPVLTTNLVSVWAGLKMLGYGAPIAGYGMLLRDHLALERSSVQASELEKSA